MPRARLRDTCLAVAIAGIAVAGCGRPTPTPAPGVTRIAMLEAVNSPGGLVDSLALAPDAGEAGPVSLGGYRQAIADLAFAPAGRLLASLGRQRESTVRLWRADDDAGPWVETASLPVDRCLALRFDGTGTRLAVLCESEVLLVDGGTLQAMRRVPSPYLGPMTAVDLSADGRRLLTAGRDGELTVWDAGSATVVRRFSVTRSRRPHAPVPGVEPPEVFAVVVALSGDGSRAAAVTIEGTVYAWDVVTGEALFDHADGEADGPPTGSLRFGRDGGLLAPMGDRFGLRHIDLAAKASRALNASPRAYHTVAIAEGGTAFAAVTSAAEGEPSYAVEVWRVGGP